VEQGDGNGARMGCYEATVHRSVVRLDFAESANSRQCVRKVLEENRQVAVAIISLRVIERLVFASADSSLRVVVTGRMDFILTQSVCDGASAVALNGHSENPLYNFGGFEIDLPHAFVGFAFPVTVWRDARNILAVASVGTLRRHDFDSFA